MPLPEYDPGFPTPPDRFDQKNEMFRRSRWDPEVLALGERFYGPAVLSDRPGWGQAEFSALNAAWSLDMNFSSGVGVGDEGLYDWEGPSGRAEELADLGGRLQGEPRELSRMVKSAARRFGADLVGIARVHPNWIYSRQYDRRSGDNSRVELPEGVDKAVVLAVEMDYDQVRSGSLVLRGVATGLGYSTMAHLANLVAVFIRGLGYRALPSGNDTGLSVPLAMAAGLGEAGRMGLLITEEFGPRVRLCKVYTDMPLAEDSYQPFGVTEFCRTCKVCAEKCPSQAISRGEPGREGHSVSNQPGPLKWYNKAENCFRYWASIRTDCVQCIRVCPFNKPRGRIHDLSRRLIRLRLGPVNRLLVRLDSALGYHKTFPPDRFWS